MSVTVHIKYGEVEETFNGDVESVWTSVNRFFGKMVPLLNVMKGVVLTVDLSEVAEACKGLVAVGEEGPVVLVSREKLTDSEGLLLMMLAVYLGNRLGVSDKDWVSKDELQKWLGKSGKIVGTRMGELCRDGLAVRSDDGCYRLSTLGVKRLVEEVLPQVSDKV